MVRSPAFHAGSRGSNPLRITLIIKNHYNENYNDFFLFFIDYIFCFLSFVYGVLLHFVYKLVLMYCINKKTAQNLYYSISIL